MLCSAFEGEIFGGIYINSDSNDTEILLQALGKCCSSNSHLCTITDSCDGKRQSSIPGVLSAIKGPWAVIYWQVTGKLLFVSIACVNCDILFSSILFLKFTM